MSRKKIVLFNVLEDCNPTDYKIWDGNGKVILENVTWRKSSVDTLLFRSWENRTRIYEYRSGI